jgi:multicomponent Na+:H+ antiporter subunit E
MNLIILGLMILFTYLALSTNIDLYNVLLGAVIAGVILLLIPPRQRPVRIRNIPRGLWAMVVYLYLVAKNVLLGGIQVARLVLDPGMPLKSGVVAIKPACDHELGQALIAHAISLSPGELLIETGEDGTMYIHSLDVDQTEQVTGKQQKYWHYLLNLIFGDSSRE